MYGPNAIDWNDGAVSILKTMWAAGRSHSQIAVEIPNATRSAIAGKIMRLKLPPRDKGRASPQPSIRVPRAAPPPRPGKITSVSRSFGSTFSEAPQRRNPTNSLAAKLAIAEAEPGLPPRLKGEAPDGTGIQLRDLSSLNCHWPRGDPLEDNFEFCGAKALKGLPYCAGHSRIAYAPAALRPFNDRRQRT